MSDANPMNPNDYRAGSFPPDRKVLVDWLVLGERRHMMHGLARIDVDEARVRLRQRTLSMTAWIVACVARAVADNPEVQACRDWRGRWVLFADVDVTVLIEVELGERRFPLAHVIRAANRRSVEELTDEIRAIKNDPSQSRSGSKLRWIRYWVWVPGPIRRAAYRLVLASPKRRKKLVGTVSVSAIGMFGAGAYGIPAPTVYPLQVTVGGLVTQPVWTPDGIEPRAHLQLTLSFDHDMVDGGPAARFGAQLNELLRTGGLIP
jgi:pyruvate/2-oxoglutarate dehydrogenase complex dihydrolipoamide acyltransferase (E2) component